MLTRSRKTCLSIAAILMLFLLSGAVNAYSYPAVIDAGVSSSQKNWVFQQPLQNEEVKFWLRVQRQGNLSRFGTFDFYFGVQVFRPDGTEVWNTKYGFDEQGYAEQTFSLPALFYERSANRNAPSFGTWKVIVAVTEKDTGKKVSVKEYPFNFVAAQSAAKPPTAKQRGGREAFPAPAFKYKRWDLKGWGIGIIDEVTTGPDSYDKQVNILDSKRTFSAAEVSSAWGNGHKFGAWLTGPKVGTYRDQNNYPLYLFGYKLHRPNGDIDGAAAQYRQNSYCNNPGTVVFPFDLRQPGNYRLEYFIRDRDKNAWEEASWVSIGNIEFEITE